MSKQHLYQSAKITLTLTSVTDKDTEKGEQAVATYRSSGGGSNRTDWSRLALVAGAIATVLRTGKAVEVTDYFPATYVLAGGVTKSVTAPAYNVAHRALSAGAIRPDWHKVRVVALADCHAGNVDRRGGRGLVTGTSNTTARIGSVRLFYIPND